MLIFRLFLLSAYRMRMRSCSKFLEPTEEQDMVDPWEDYWDPGASIDYVKEVPQS